MVTDAQLPPEILWGLSMTMMLILVLSIAFVVTLFAANKKLKKERQFSANIIETISAYVIVLNEDGRIVQLNNACAQLTGLSAENLADAPAKSLQLIPEKLLAINPRDDAEYRRSPYIENKYVDPEGAIHFIDWQVNNLYDRNDRLLKIFFGLDVTDRKTAEAVSQEYQKKLRSLASELTLTEERERRELAGDLHDVVGQKLALATLKIARIKSSKDEESFQSSIDSVYDLIQDVITDTRSLMYSLSPRVLYDLGFVAAIETLTEQFKAKYQLPVTFSTEGKIDEIDEKIAIVLFRAVRELLMNALKHARATTVQVSVRQDEDNLILVVDDDGIGFESQHKSASMSSKNKRFGLFDIYDRLDFHGIDIDIQSADEQGTKAIIRMPLKESEE